MNSNTSILNSLRKTETILDYEKAFGDATGLPITLVPKDNLQLPLHGKRHENPFCAILAKSKACAGCLQMQSSLTGHAGEKACVQTCPFKLVEAAVPVRIGKETAGFLITGQVMHKKPTEVHFNSVAKKLGPSVDIQKAREAYMATPVVPKRTINSAVQLLSIFAEHLAIKGNHLVTQATHTEPFVVTKARQYLSEHLEEDVTLEDTAKAAGASTFYLCKLFRRHLDMTFTEYLSRSRVERAKEMLEKPNMRVSEVAFEAGFQSLTHFNRIFRKIVGGSPSEYRAQLAVA